MKFDKHGILEMAKMNYEPDRPKATNPIKIQDLSFRDGHQKYFCYSRKDRRYATRSRDDG